MARSDTKQTRCILTHQKKTYNGKTRESYTGTFLDEYGNRILLSINAEGQKPKTLVSTNDKSKGKKIMFVNVVSWPDDGSYTPKNKLR